MIGTQTNRIYPWFIAVFAGIALMVSNGQTISGLSVFDVEFINEFGWSRGEIKLRDMVTLLLAGLAAPFVGVLLDRYGVRRCMLAGWCVLILSYFAYSRLGSLTGLYLIHAAFALVLVVCGLNAAVILGPSGSPATGARPSASRSWARAWAASYFPSTAPR